MESLKINRPIRIWEAGNVPPCYQYIADDVDWVAVLPNDMDDNHIPEWLRRASICELYVNISTLGEIVLTSTHA